MTQESTIQPFEAGDILVGCTLLNDPDDDHAGPGRIIQFDSDLNEKGVLWTEGTTHLITGLKFGPDKTLWGFDNGSFSVLNISPEGKRLPNPDFPKKSFSNMVFLDDGSVLLGEHLVGDQAGIKLPPDRPLGTVLPNMPGADHFGDGHVFRCSTDGKVIKEYATKTHGGMPGFLGVNNTVMAPDGKTLQYLSELSDGIYQYDIEADQQRDDLLNYEKGEMAMSLNRMPNGQLLHIRANFKVGFFLDLLNEDGSREKETLLPGPGWACLGNGATDDYALIGNFFTGAVAKFDLDSGDIIAQGETGVERSLAGIAQFPG